MHAGFVFIRVSFLFVFLSVVNRFCSLLIALHEKNLLKPVLFVVLFYFPAHMGH